MKIRIQIIAIIFSTVLFSSCGDRAKEVKESLSNSSTLIKNTANIVKDSKNIQKDVQALMELEPIEKATFKNWLPKTMHNLPMHNSTFNLIPEIATCSGTYRADGKEITMSIIDGAGNKGAAAIGPYRLMESLTMEQSGDNGYQKMVIANGINANERYNTYSDQYDITFLYKKRLAVHLKTKKLTRKETWQVLEDFNLDDLLN